MSTREEWESIISRLSDEKTRKDNPPVVLSFLSSVVTLILIFSIFGVGLMLANMLAIRAWPSADFLNPGVGYLDAFLLSSVWWTLLLVKKTILGGLAVAMNGKGAK